MIENVPDLAPMNAGAMKPTTRDVAVSSALAEALRMVQPVALQKGQEIRTHYPERAGGGGSTFTALPPLAPHEEPAA